MIGFGSRTAKAIRELAQALYPAEVSRKSFAGD
jgi:hypothetical protein